ncbi:unnamed protein product, partial [Mesorhabditis spiculigera]
MLYRAVLSVVVLATLGSACDVAWPNKTDTTLNWFPSCSSPSTLYGIKAQDQSGKAEYPISLTAPLVIVADIETKRQYQSPGLKQTINLWSWGSFAGCTWSAVPTLGLLKDLDACTNGVPCPVKPGRQTLPITMDFTGYDAIIKLLKDDSPYQLEMILHDQASGDQTCVTAQARTYTKQH